MGIGLSRLKFHMPKWISFTALVLFLILATAISFQQVLYDHSTTLFMPWLFSEWYMKLIMITQSILPGFAIIFWLGFLNQTTFEIRPIKHFEFITRLFPDFLITALIADLLPQSSLFVGDLISYYQNSELAITIFVSLLCWIGLMVVAGFVAQIGRDFPERTKGYKVSVEWIVSIWLVCGSYIAYNISTFIEQTAYDISGFDYLQIVQNSTYYLSVLNLIIIAMWFLVLLTVINRFWVSSSIFAITMLVLSFANAEKMKFRNDPVIFPDVSFATSLPDIARMVDLTVVFTIIVSALIVIISSIYLQHRNRFGHVFSLPVRIVALGFAIMVLGRFAVVENQMNKEAFSDTKSKFNDPIGQLIAFAGYHAHPETLDQEAENYGPALTFTSTEIIKTMHKPANYSAKYVKKVVKKYQTLADQINQDRANTDLSDQTVVYLLSESFAEPSRVPSIKFSKNPTPFIDQMKQQNTSGLMYSPGYGGGTANIEFETLTGLSMNNFDPSLATPYVFLVPKVQNLPVITDWFKTKNAIHPYTSTTYGRGKVFNIFGFQNFYTVDNHNLKNQTVLDNSAYISDKSAFKQTLKQINDVKGGQFIQLSTMQNHMPYISGTYAENNYHVSGDITKSNQAEIESYTQGIHYTDQALKTFIQKISKMKKHVTVVFYGDHLPVFIQANYKMKLVVMLSCIKRTTLSIVISKPNQSLTVKSSAQICSLRC